MDHTEALKKQTGERYLLGHLPDSELLEFEQHYFSCPECTADLEAGSVFIANARAVFEEEEAASAAVELASQKPGFRSRWKDLMAGFWPRPSMAATSFASFALGCISLYQVLAFIPNLKSNLAVADGAVSLPSFQLAGRTRGETGTVSLPRNSRFFAISFDVDPQAVYPDYRCDLKDLAGAVRFSAPAPAPPAGQPITLLIPAHDLPAGEYTLVLSGVRPAGAGLVRISDYAFNLELK
jgi:hypothetical protein